MSNQSASSSFHQVDSQSVPSVWSNMAAPTPAPAPAPSQEQNTTSSTSYNTSISSSLSLTPQYNPSIWINSLVPLPVPTRSTTLSASPQDQILYLPSSGNGNTLQQHYIIRRSLGNPNVWEVVSEIAPLAAPMQWQIISAQTNTQPPFVANQLLQQINPYLGQPQHFPVSYTSKPMELRRQDQFGTGDEIQNADDFIEIPRGSAFGNTLMYSDFRPHTSKSNLLSYLQSLGQHLKNKILELLKQHGGIK
ncbi:MAG: hypothetical protein FD167_4236, partial [bacterium]